MARAPVADQCKRHKSGSKRHESEGGEGGAVTHRESDDLNGGLRYAKLVLLSQVVALLEAENQVFEEIQFLARGGPNEFRSERSTVRVVYRGAWERTRSRGADEAAA